MKFRFSLSLVFLLFLYISWSNPAFCEETPKITVEPYSFSKTIVKVIPFKGNQNLSKKLTLVLVRLLNYHIFILASSESAIVPPTNREYLIKGNIQIKGKRVLLSAELWDNLENRVMESYRIEGPLRYPYLVVYSLCNKVVEKLSGYKGLAFSRIAFVKRTSYEDKLYITDFSKVNPYLLISAPLILFPKISPKGDKLACLVYKKGKFFLVVFDFKKRIKKSFFIKGICSTPVWAPDEEHLFLTIENKGNLSIAEFDLKTKVLKFILKGEGVYQAGSVSRDGRFLSYVYNGRAEKPKVYILDLKTLQSYKVSQAFNYDTSPRFSPKKNVLLYLERTQGSTYIILYNLNDKNRKKLQFSGYLEDPSFSPTGDYIIAYGTGPKGTGIYLIHLDSDLSYLYIKGKNFLYPDWGKL